MADIERADRLVEGGGAERADQLGQPPLRESLCERNLGEAQMGVHEAEREGEVVVARRLDIGHLIGVPADRDRMVERQAGGRKDGEAFGGRNLARKERGARAGGDGEKDDGDAGEEAGHEGSSPG